jgi:hypothetical protein
MMNDLGVMIGIVVFVMAAQAVLWSWVLLRRRKVAPDVAIFNWRELYDATRAWIDSFSRRG